MDTCHFSCGCVLVVALWFFVRWFLCGWLVVDHAIEPVERVMCLNVAIVSLSCHGRNAKHVPSLVLLLFLCCVSVALVDRAFEPSGK
jgi:hypothetical protein